MTKKKAEPVIIKSSNNNDHNINNNNVLFSKVDKKPEVIKTRTIITKPVTQDIKARTFYKVMCEVNGKMEMKHLNEEEYQEYKRKFDEENQRRMLQRQSLTSPSNVVTTTKVVVDQNYITPQRKQIVVEADVKGTTPDEVFRPSNDIQNLHIMANKP